MSKQRFREILAVYRGGAHKSALKASVAVQEGGVVGRGLGVPKQWPLVFKDFAADIFSTLSCVNMPLHT